MLCGVVLVCCSVLGAAPAVAHSDLVASSPAAGERLAAAPTQVVLEFDVRVEPQHSRLVLLDARGRVHGSALLTSATGAVLVAVLEPGGEAGGWRIVYDVRAADGHTVSGSIPFTVRSGQVTASAARTADWAVPALLLVLCLGVAATVGAMPGTGGRRARL